MHNFTEKLKFFSAFLRSPKQIGSVIPTSRPVIDHILDQISWPSTRLIVEYGPGMGTITAPLLNKLPADGRLIAIDLNPDFITHLNGSIHDPRLIAVQGSAADVQEIVARYAPDERKVDYCVSGLPFSTLPTGLDDQIMAATQSVIAPGGAFLVYQYSRYVVPLLRRHFDELGYGRIWANIPPCYVFRALKAKTAPVSRHITREDSAAA